MARCARARRWPWLTLLVCALCVLATAADQMAARSSIEWWSTVDRLFRVPLQGVWAGAWWGMLTSAFVHGTPASPGITLLHLGINLAFFWRLGAALENTLSPLQWLLFLATAAVVSSGAEITLSSMMSVGISGVLYAAFGLMWAARRKRTEWAGIATWPLLLELLLWGLFCVVAAVVFHWPIANAAHAGGFVYGLAVGWLYSEGLRLVPVLVVCGMATVPVAAGGWMPWSGEWCEWRGSAEASQRRYASAVWWYRRSLRLGQPPDRVWAEVLAAQVARKDAAGAREALSQLAQHGALRVLVRPRARVRGVTPRNRPFWMP